MGDVIPINAKSEWKDAPGARVDLAQLHFFRMNGPLPHKLVMEIYIRRYERVMEQIEFERLLDVPPEPPPSAS